MEHESSWYCERSGHLSVDQLDMSMDSLRRLRVASLNLRVVGLSPYALSALKSTSRPSRILDDAYGDD